MKKKIDIIVSCYNEENNIFAFYDETKKYLNNIQYEYNIFYINDGSTDKTYENIVNLYNSNLKNKNRNFNISYISFTHNFGHEAAMCAGLENSKADYLIFIDADLQNPPQKIIEIIDKFEKGSDCVLLKRVKYSSATLIKKLTSKGYYLISKYIFRNKNENDVSDFFAIDKNLANVVKLKYKTRLRFIRSFVQKEAKKTMFVNYENAERHSGVSRYSYFKLLKLAIISELSRSKFLRDKYKATDDYPVYIIDNERSIYQ